MRMERIPTRSLKDRAPVFASEISRGVLPRKVTLFYLMDSLIYVLYTVFIFGGVAGSVGVLGPLLGYVCPALRKCTLPPIPGWGVVAPAPVLPHSGDLQEWRHEFSCRHRLEM